MSMTKQELIILVVLYIWIFIGLAFNFHWWGDWKQTESDTMKCSTVLVDENKTFIDYQDCYGKGEWVSPYTDIVGIGWLFTMIVWVIFFFKFFIKK